MQSEETLTINLKCLFVSFQDDEYDLSWWVPLTFTDPKSGFNNTYSKLWLEPDAEAKEVVQMPDSDSPVIFNVQQTGFYRYGIKKSDINC